MNTLKLIGVFLIVMGLCSCQTDRQNSTAISDLISITENENTGIEVVLNFYGGYCKYSLGAKVSTSEGKQKYFGIDLGESSVLDETSLPLKVVASNVAYLFFHELEEERKSYDYYRVTLEKAGQESKIFEINTDDLLIVEEKQKSLAVVENLTRNQSYVELIELFPENSKIRTLDSEEMINNLLLVDSVYGKVNQPILLLGFETFFYRSKDERIRLFCIQRRIKRDLEYKLDLAKSKDSKKMYDFDYSY